MDDEKPDKEPSLIDVAVKVIDSVLMIHDEKMFPSEKEDLFLAKGHLLIMKERGLR